jgi:signal peptidase I
MFRSVRPSCWVALLGFTTLLAASPLTIAVVQGHSMEPTLHPGTVSLLDRSYYHHHALSRGDIVVLRVQGDTVIKRVYALPGERVTLLHYDDGASSEVVTAPEAARLRGLKASGFLPDCRVMSVTVPSGHCFVLGDNPLVSVDSRDWGPVPMSAILARAIL